jgi:nitroimidazol reductase NimA-like FMN-containing flavoprotein (pyridoxamine 5'-phosphate oxidase superfamily)
MEILSLDQCWKLLEEMPVGRLAVMGDGRPDVFPVNFGVLDRAVVFRTEMGAKLHAVATHGWVALEADQIDIEGRRGWSVVVKGRAGELTRPEDVARASDLPLQLWVPGQKTRWVRIDPTEVTGRRLRIGIDG